MKLTPHDYQERNIALVMAEPTKAALIGSEMGRGKTLVACEVMLRLGLKRVLIVGVKDTFDQFRERLEAQSNGATTARRIDATKAGRAALADFLAGGEGIFFAGIQYITAQDWKHEKQFNEDGTPKMVLDKKTGEPTARQESKRVHQKIYKKMKPVDMLVWDEIDMGSNRKSIAAFTMKTLASEWKIAMSGTFYGNKFENAWTVARWLWPLEIDGSFIRWKQVWCQRETIYVAGGREQEVIKGEVNPGTFVASLPCYIRDEAPEKPPKPKLVYVELTPKQRAQYDELERDLMVWLNDRASKGFTPLIAEAPIALRGRLRTAALGEMSFDDNGDIGFAGDAHSSKLQALGGVLAYYEKQEPGQPVAIYTHDKRYAKLVVARMLAAGYNVAEWSGDVKGKERDEIKRRFLAGELQYLVCVVRAFRAGLDGFQTVCNKVVWLSEVEGDQATNSQSLARFFRPGRVGEFEHVKILAKDTHDVGVYSQLVTLALSLETTMRFAA